MERRYAAKKKINRLRTFKDIPIIFDEEPTHAKHTKIYRGIISGNKVMASWNPINGCYLHALDDIQLRQSYNKALERLLEN